MSDRSMRFEAIVGVPSIPFCTSHSLTPEDARKVAAALEEQARAYKLAAAEAEHAALNLGALGYEGRPTVEQRGNPYNHAFHPLLALVVARPKEDDA